MAKKLFLSSVRVEDGQVLLGFSPGRTVSIGESQVRRELPDGITEHAASLTDGDDRFDLRTLVDADGRILKAVASAEPISEDWYE
jgi:hypothetical protein